MLNSKLSIKKFISYIENIPLQIYTMNTVKELIAAAYFCYKKEFVIIIKYTNY